MPRTREVSVAIERVRVIRVRVLCVCCAVKAKSLEYIYTILHWLELKVRVKLAGMICYQHKKVFAIVQ